MPNTEQELTPSNQQTACDGLSECRSSGGRIPSNETQDQRRRAPESAPRSQSVYGKHTKRQVAALLAVRCIAWLDVKQAIICKSSRLRDFGHAGSYPW